MSKFLQEHHLVAFSVSCALCSFFSPSNTFTKVLCLCLLMLLTLLPESLFSCWLMTAAPAFTCCFLYMVWFLPSQGGLDLFCTASQERKKKSFCYKRYWLLPSSYVCCSLVWFPIVIQAGRVIGLVSVEWDLSVPATWRKTYPYPKHSIVGKSPNGKKLSYTIIGELAHICINYVINCYTFWWLWLKKCTWWDLKCKNIQNYIYWVVSILEKYVRKIKMGQNTPNNLAFTK